MDLVCLDIWVVEWPFLPWCFAFSFFQDWFSIWPNQSPRLLNQTEPIGLTWAGWNMRRAGKDKSAPFWKAYRAETCSSLPASEHSPEREPVQLSTTPAGGAITDLGVFPSEKLAVWRGRRALSRVRTVLHRPGSRPSIRGWSTDPQQPQRKLGGTM